MTDSAETDRCDFCEQGKVMKRNGQMVGVDFARLTRLGD